MHPSAVRGLLPFISTMETDVQDRWAQWAELAARQHLLVSCCILDLQQITLFARDAELLPQISIEDLPFPTKRSLWDATCSDQWFDLAQQLSTMPGTIIEASNCEVTGNYEDFQAAVLIATHYARFNGHEFYLSADIDHLLTKSPKIEHQFLTAKLVRLVPVRALLAVSGEAWVLGTKITSQPQYIALRLSLQTWLSRLWCCSGDDKSQTTAEALRLSILVLRLSLTTPELFANDHGHEIGLLIAVLVIWAATVAAGTRFIASGSSARQSDLALQASDPSVAQLPIGLVVETHLSSLRSAEEASGLYQDRQVPLALPRSSIPHSEIALTTSNFLDRAIDDISSLNVIPCRTGCTSLLLWFKMYIRGVSLHDQNAAVPDVASIGDYFGELISIIFGQIERMLSQGWEGWGI